MHDLSRRFGTSQHLLPLILRSLTAVVSGLSLIACAGPAHQPGQQAHGDAASRPPADSLASSALPGVSVEDRALDAQAFAAEASFLFPEESRALAHALLRSEFARLESERLGLEPERAEVDAALAASVEGLRAQAPGGSLHEWARQRYGRGWEPVEAGLRQRLEDNQRFQLCARAWSLQQGRVELRMLTTRDETIAHDWIRRLGAGASFEAMLRASLDAGPSGDGKLPWLPQATSGWIPEERFPSQLSVGAIFGPIQLPGESVWRVFEVLALEAAVETVPPRQTLLAGLREQPVGALEERAWFVAMSARYNAREGLPAFETPTRSFVRPRLR